MFSHYLKGKTNAKFYSNRKNKFNRVDTYADGIAIQKARNRAIKTTN